MPAAKVEVDLMLIVGQLRESVQAAADGIKSLSVESRSTSNGLLVVGKTIEHLDELVRELDDVVRSTTEHSLVNQIQAARHNLAQLRNDVDDLKKRIGAVARDVDSLESHRDQLLGAKWVILGLVSIVGTALGILATYMWR